MPAIFTVPAYHLCRRGDLRRKLASFGFPNAGYWMIERVHGIVPRDQMDLYE